MPHEVVADLAPTHPAAPQTTGNVTMLDRHEISFGCLTTYLGFILGLGLLALSELLEKDDLVRWGIATLCCACTYSLHRSLSTYKERLLEAFTMGREYERARDHTGDLTSIR